MSNLWTRQQRETRISDTACKPHACDRIIEERESAAWTVDALVKALDHVYDCKSQATCKTCAKAWKLRQEVSR